MFIYCQKKVSPVRSFVDSRLTKVRIFQLSSEQFLTSLDEAPRREESVGGERVDPSLVMRKLQKYRKVGPLILSVVGTTIAVCYLRFDLIKG